MKPHRPLGNPIKKAWIAGWDASLTYERNPYTRKPQHDAFVRGKKAGVRSSDEDVAILKRLTAERNH
jgi:hypothetical protein